MMTTSKSDRISPREAAEIIGISEKTLRKDMIEGNFNPPIGRVRKSRSTYNLDIYRKMVLRYVGETDENTN